MRQSDLTICLGPAGTGKTFVSIKMALQMLSLNQIDKIIISKPCVEIGDTLGYLKGTLQDKILPFFENITEELNDQLGKQETIANMAIGAIKFVPLQFVRGRNFKHSFIFLDEAQSATYKQLKAFVTRMCKGSKIVMNGDTSQADIDDSGFQEAIDHLSQLEEVKVVRLTEADNHRHDLVSKILKVMK